jgi:hypothetical protein
MPLVLMSVSRTHSNGSAHSMPRLSSEVAETYGMKATRALVETCITEARAA